MLQILHVTDVNMHVTCTSLASKSATLCCSCARARESGRVHTQRQGMEGHRVRSYVNRLMYTARAVGESRVPRRRAPSTAGRTRLDIRDLPPRKRPAMRTRTRPAMRTRTRPAKHESHHVNMRFCDFNVLRDQWRRQEQSRVRDAHAICARRSDHDLGQLRSHHVSSEDASAGRVRVRMAGRVTMSTCDFFSTCMSTCSTFS
jgi:hypothetical protein